MINLTSNNYEGFCFRFKTESTGVLTLNYMGQMMTLWEINRHCRLLEPRPCKNVTRKAIHGLHREAYARCWGSTHLPICVGTGKFVALACSREPTVKFLDT